MSSTAVDMSNCHRLGIPVPEPDFPKRSGGPIDSGHDSEFAANFPAMLYRYLQHSDGTLETLFIGGAVSELYEFGGDGDRTNDALVTRIVHPDDWDEYFAALEAGAKGLEPCSVEFRVITCAGNLKWVHAVARPKLLGNGDILWDGIAVDVTARRIAEQGRRGPAGFVGRAGISACHIQDCAA